jgi:hypothetical protein
MHELKLYDLVIKATVTVSAHQHGISADGRGVRGMKVFTRQTLVALSLHKILPRPSPVTHHESVLWDVTSIASLSRNLLEGYLSLHYFGIEKVSAEEAELRFFIAQLHRNVEWYEIRRLTDSSDSGLGKFEAGIPKQKETIKNHPFLLSLSPAQRSRALAGAEMYKTKSDFERRIDTCKHLRRNFRLLSNLVHPLPLSIERINNQSGRGTGTEPDINYIVMCLVIARRFLAASTVGIADHFSDALASKFEKVLAPVRPLCVAD